jgi:hypothetical protein
MIRRGPFALTGTVAIALLALFSAAASAAGPQPDPPAFGMFGITGFQRAILYVGLGGNNTLPNANTRPGINTDPCTVDVSFVNEDGKTVFMETHTIKPGTTSRAMYTGPTTLPALTDAVAPIRQQLRGVIVPVPGDSRAGDACAGLVATVQVDNGAGAPTLTVSPVLSPRDAASGLPTGKRQHKPFVITTGPLTISSGHTARLNVLNTGPGDDLCTFTWDFVDETGARTGGVARAGAGQAVHADFAHTDPQRGPAAIHAEVTVNEPDRGSCPSDPTVTLEGFDSALGHTHSIVPAQLFLPAVQ